MLPSLISLRRGRRFTFVRIDISYARFFFNESAEKVLSYARLNFAVFNSFYMSLGQVRHTIQGLGDRTHISHQHLCSSVLMIFEGRELRSSVAFLLT